MKFCTWFSLFTLFMATTMGQKREGNEAHVKYLGGIVYILPDGCPTAEEDAKYTFGSVRSTREQRLQQYRDCLQEEQIRENVTADKLWTQCVTDKLPHIGGLTVPVYTNICSAQCHAHLNVHKHTQNYFRSTGTAKYKNCPVNGRRVGTNNEDSLNQIRNGGDSEIDAPLADAFLG